LQSRDFKRDAEDPAKFERYQAEALVHQHCPISGLLGIVCYTDKLKASLEKQLLERQLSLKIFSRQDWYF
jgi:hypothetical protein